MNTTISDEKGGIVSRTLRGYGRLTIFLIPLGVALNFVGGQIAALLKLPVYLDGIGTVLVGAVCGIWPGALTGLLSNLVNSITIPTLIAYAPLGIMIGALAGVFGRLGVFRNYWKTALTAIPFAFIGGVLGAVITILVYGGLGAGWGADVIVALLVATGVPIDAANFFVAIPADLLDKLITVTLVFLVLLRLPTRLLLKLPLGDRYLRRTTTTPPAAKV